MQNVKEVPVPAGIGMTMLYVEANKRIPTGVVSSSARKGRKWFDDLMVGEVFRCVNKDTGDLITRAVCVRKELLPYRDVILTAYDNHVAWENPELRTYTPAVMHSRRLQEALQAAYGSNICEDEPFSKIHLLPLLDWAEDNVRAVYYGARWTPDRVVDSERLWERVRDSLGFKKGETLVRLGPPAWAERYIILKNRAILAREQGALSIYIEQPDYLQLDDHNCIDWLNPHSGGALIPTFLGLVVDRLGATAEVPE